MSAKLLRKNEIFENPNVFNNEIDLHIKQNIRLKDHTSMKIGGFAKNFIITTDEKGIIDAYKFATERRWKVYPLGGGNNTVFSDKDHDICIIKIESKGIVRTYDGPEFMNIEVQAGEEWDDLVNWSVQNGLSGLECLSGIPGTVGAAPIQNIGAYGSEIKGTLSKVKILDFESSKVFEISNIDCKLQYRDSIFKQNPGRFIILSVSFSLSKKSSNLHIPTYKDVQLYFLGKKQGHATALQIRNAILKIRSEKIPWPSDIPNSGSFFKNPVISNELASKIARENPEIPYFKIDENHTKLYAGWLIEKSDLKGFNFGRIKIDNKNALILTNPKGLGNFDNLEKAIRQIQASIFQKFEIELEIEPNVIY